MNHHSLLVVDDEQSQREALRGFLQKKGYAVLSAENGTQAVSTIQKETVDLVLTDLRMPGMDGLRLLQETKKINPEIIVIVMTAFGEIETAIQSIKEGAADFINKPLNLGQLEVIIEKALERKQLVSENLRLRELVKERLQFGGITSESPAMQQALSIAARAAMSKATVLIIGESGTGKELIARAIHTASPRSGEPFIAVNMAALSENLVESELFGYEKGAFTGASMMRKGRFELADKGTLFIDEVGEIPPSTQVKLLRVLQEQSVERIGASTAIHLDVRLVAATHRDLEEMVKTGEFREDFYYRLNVVRIHLPPLRERKGDIPHLVNLFINRYAQMNQKGALTVSREAMDKLMKYDYPGNIRELENIIEQAVVLCRGENISSTDLPLVLSGRPAGRSESTGSFEEQVSAFEIKLIIDALGKSGGIQTRAAALLGMSERHLRYKMQKYQLKG